ncbi:MAG: hypothetical protein IJ493_07945 [Clostridia bacterium]|nr:hypothetical protein [Clostridia bacterium]
MLYNNFELYNIAELIPAEDGGHYMSRVPSHVRAAMSEQGQRMAIGLTGCEMRFVINNGKAEITLQTTQPGVTTYALLYYGGVQAGWQTVRHYIYDHPTTITIEPPAGMDTLRAISDAAGYPYSPEVCRIVFECGSLILLDAKGDVRPPKADEVPSRRFMMYGSSITHGSLACTPNMTYLEQISRRLGMDMYSFGFAGSCCMERAVCDYICAQDETNPRRWDFAVFELGINVLHIAEDDFASRVKYLLDTAQAKNPGKKLFVIDIYYHSGDLLGSPKTDAFRRIVREACEGRENVMHIDGRTLLTSARGLSADFTHPNVDGVSEIAQNLGRILEENI